MQYKPLISLRYLCLAVLPLVAGCDTFSVPDELNTAKAVDVNTTELAAIIREQPDTLLIDVRSRDEIHTLGGTIDAPNNVNIQRGWLEFRIEEVAPDRDTPIVVYCGINQRSPLAAQSLTAMGYTNVKNYADGFFAWKEAGQGVDHLDKALDSILYERPIQVTENVWSAIGATQPPTYENSGHNNNLSFIITADGVVVFNAGGSYLLARSLHDEIRRITDKPVKYVVLENEQGHAFLGSSYWQEHGIPVIAHVDAYDAIVARGQLALERTQRIQRDKAYGTRMSLPDITFEDEHVIDLGGERIEIKYLGPAHGPGDIVAWLPAQKLVIAGDMAFHERLLPIFEYTDTAGWIETWEKFADLGAEVVIPGHGGPTDMTEVEKYTIGYLEFMRTEIGVILDAGGDMNDIYTIDQDAFMHLDTYRELAALNASTLYRSMEFE